MINIAVRFKISKIAKVLTLEPTILYFLFTIGFQQIIMSR